MIDFTLLQQGQLVALGFLLASLAYFVLLRPRILANMQKRVRDTKDQFIGLASHYLLTPITIIQTATARLQEADTTLSLEERQKLYEAISLGEQRLWIIAEQLVLINEIDNSNLELRLEVHDLPDTISSAIAAIDVFARHKKLTIAFEDTTQEIKQARIDTRRVKQAIIAVLDNAIKFSMEGTTINVRLSLNEGIFTLEIEDEGIGMPADVIAHLSEKFYRGSSIYSFDYEGLGLGLHIAYAIVRMHKGNITFQSRMKRGTLVTIELPNL
jgi:signal transduction histidine kinase